MTEPILRHGDARDLGILGLSDASVDCIITSPPYWHLKHYADGDAREIGHQQSRDDYLRAVGDVFGECLRLAKTTGVMWLVVDTLREPSRGGGLAELVPLPFELAAVARAKGWRLQDVVIWEKNKTLPYSGTGKLRNLIEYVLFLTKSNEFKHRPYRCAERHRPGAEWLAGWPERYHPLGRRPSNLWQFDIDTQGIWDHSAGFHSCPFPQELVARLIELTSDKGDVILDPFAGIGTVPAQAAAMARRGYGVELSPEHVRVFSDRTLPGFQATWEAGSEIRRLARQDQVDEAVTILKLRFLKAGKELMRATDRLAQQNPGDHPAAAVESVVVLEPQDLAQYLDPDSGRVARVPVRLLLLADLPQPKRAVLLRALGPLLDNPPFTTFGLDISLDVSSASNLGRRGLNVEALFEFGQSRQGAFTAPIDQRLFSVRPRLLTTTRLPSAIPGNGLTMLDRVKLKAEYELLQREAASGDTVEVIANRLGVPQARLHELLLEHGLLEPARSFAIALPSDQLPLELAAE